MGKNELSNENTSVPAWFVVDKETKLIKNGFSFSRGARVPGCVHSTNATLDLLRMK